MKLLLVERECVQMVMVGCVECYIVIFVVVVIQNEDDTMCTWGVEDE